MICQIACSLHQQRRKDRNLYQVKNQFIRDLLDLMLLHVGTDSVVVKEDVASVERLLVSRPALVRGGCPGFGSTTVSGSGVRIAPLRRSGYCALADAWRRRRAASKA
jgi:hypothetical protein